MSRLEESPEDDGVRNDDYCQLPVSLLELRIHRIPVRHRNLVRITYLCRKCPHKSSRHWQYEDQDQGTRKKHQKNS